MSRYEAGTKPMRTDKIDLLVNALQARGVRFSYAPGTNEMAISMALADDDDSVREPQ